MRTLLDHNGHIPAFVAVTDAKTHESRMSKIPESPKGVIMLFDKAFIDAFRLSANENFCLPAEGDVWRRAPS